MQIAATEQALALDIRRRLEAPDTHPTFDVRVHLAKGIVVDPLLSAIPLRSVNRRPYSTRPVSPDAMKRLQAALPAGYTLHWYSRLGERWRMARLMFANAKLRLTLREAYEVHRAIIDWNQRFSADRVPDQALGVDAMTLKLMRWAMTDWRRVSFMNRWLGGTVAPRLQMDLLPSLMCAAHVAIVADLAPTTIDHWVKVGRAVQRFWLASTSMGLQHQPELTPLIFARYVRDGVAASSDSRNTRLMTALAQLSGAAVGGSLAATVWLGRIGYARASSARSLRLSINDLQQHAQQSG